MNFQFEYKRLLHQLGLQRRWWFKVHRPYQPLFVVASCRTGSNLLLSYLNNQPAVCMRGELLYPGSPFGVRRYKTPPASALHHIRLSLQSLKSPIRGCKIMLYQLANCRLSIDDVGAAFPNAKYIILYRENLARQFVSHRLADITQQYALRAGDDKKLTRITVQPEELSKYCNETQEGYRELLRHGCLQKCSVLLSYEELVQNADLWLRQVICPMLGIEAVAASTNFQKQNSQPLDDVITNYAQVEHLLPSCRQRLEWAHSDSTLTSVSP